MKRNAPKTTNAVVAYVRVSTEEQATEGVSLAAQEDRIRAYCAMRGLELAEVVVDAGVSAYKPLAEREGGRRVLDMVKARKVAAVVALKLDRLFRNAADCLDVCGAWDRAGVALHLVDLGGQAVDTSSAMGRFFLTIMSGCAELERNQCAERTALAMAHKASRGEFCGGQAPYGMRVADDGVTLEADEAEQRVIRAVHEAAGRGLSVRAIAAELAAAGIVSRTGKPLGKSAVHTILTRAA